MGFSRIFNNIIRSVFSSKEDDAPKQSKIVSQTQRDASDRLDETVSESHMRFQGGIKEEDLKPYRENMVSGIVTAMNRKKLTIIDTIMANLTGKKKVPEDVATNEIQGYVPLEKFEEEAEPKTTLYNKIQLKDGRFVSPSHLRAILERATISQLSSDMSRPSAPLKYRTGRFANSVRIDSIYVTQDGFLSNNKENIHVDYSYMESPYSVFDPSVSTYRGLSLRPYRGARSPTRLIPKAMETARLDLISPRYDFFINKR